MRDEYMREDIGSKLKGGNKKEEPPPFRCPQCRDEGKLPSLAVLMPGYFKCQNGHRTDVARPAPVVEHNRDTYRQPYSE